MKLVFDFTFNLINSNVMSPFSYLSHRVRNKSNDIFKMASNRYGVRTQGMKLFLGGSEMHLPGEEAILLLGCKYSS